MFYSVNCYSATVFSSLKLTGSQAVSLLNQKHTESCFVGTCLRPKWFGAACAARAVLNDVDLWVQEPLCTARVGKWLAMP